MTDSYHHIKNRKKDHLDIAISDEVQTGSNGLEHYRFSHNSLPELNYDEIDTSTTFLSKKVDLPVFVSCMTGGVKDGERLNKNLAIAAEKANIALGVGSQRIAIAHPEFKSIFKIRKHAPNIPVLANIGLVQLNYGFGLTEFQKCVDMVGADALVVHVNPIQEIIQPGGNRNWRGLLTKLEKIIKKLSVPVIAKEVGFGLSGEVVRRLFNIGVRMFDTAGWGGTNWALVESLRGDADISLGRLFSKWGTPTAESIVQVNQFKSTFKKNITILGSGGIRNGVEIAKSISLGADLAGIASPFAVAALKSSDEVSLLIERYSTELKVAMFGVGAKNIQNLKKVKLMTSCACAQTGS